MTITTPLPIDEVLPRLQATLATHRIVVVQAPPGAGKSTRVPLALLNSDWLHGKRIIMLEPRRLAARAVANWMAQLLGEPVGKRVGYRMRLENRVSRDTRIEVVTEGVLTRMLQTDPTLEPVGCVIFDEFHERSLHADLGLTLSLDTQSQLRPDLRLLVMSATLDTGALAAWLNNAPLIAAAGQSHPVETRYIGRNFSDRIAPEVANIVRRALREESGDALVFLPGAGEIRRVQRLLSETPMAGVSVVPLYGDLPQDAQQRAITPSPGGGRKVVLATSIAETSLTIEGVRIVVDSGLARRAQFDPRSGMTRLVTTKVSRAAADQRRGRAGRLAPGVCYRLWSEDAGNSLAEFAPPEISETDLCPLALELATWGANDPATLRWLTPPPTAPYAQARELLRRLGALDAAGCVTAHGRAMGEIGAHPRLAHMLLRSRQFGMTALACEIAALLSERDLLRIPPATSAIDMRLRLEALRGMRVHLPADADVDRGVSDRVRKQATRWRQQLDNGENRDRDDAEIDLGVGVLLSLAYPDRVARMRSTQPGRYQLSNGRGAAVAASDALARTEFLAIADLDAGDHEARIYLASPITQAQIEMIFSDQIATEQTIAWDARNEAVSAHKEMRLGSLVITRSSLDQPEPHAAAGAMLQGIRAMGIEVLPWQAEDRSWQQRVLFLRRHESGKWPDVSDASLLDRVEQWLAPYIQGITRREHLSRLNLRQALRAHLDWKLQQQLDEQAPTHLIVPSGSRIPLDYSHGDSPVLAARLQEMFGLHETPRVAGGRVSVVIHLLSPAGRAVQVTRDITSFWRSGYQEVRKELKGRYPKHYWPDDPFTAVPTRRTRPT